MRRGVPDVNRDGYKTLALRTGAVYSERMRNRNECERCAECLSCPQHESEAYADQYAERGTDLWQRLYAKILDLFQSF